ncbi:MAG TPA: cupin domain-containing protein, partial [Pyrinomonadaceae bacterium]|nr:cupin domain-containing protein [Pyrinomonadaceae bacterium]
VRPEDFFSRQWEREPLFVARDDAGLYDSLLETSDLDRLVTVALSSDSTSVETLSDPASVSVSALPINNAADSRAAYTRGATLRINGAQRLSPPLARLSQTLEQEFGCPVNFNLYATPQGARGAVRHYDNHDVLVLQLAGRKTWRIFEPLVRLPLRHVPLLAFEERTEASKYTRGGPSKGRGDIGDADVGEPTRKFTLSAGDLLYLPRGFVHEARTDDEPSLHLTAGLHVLTYLDLLTVALGQVAQRDERLRRSLPARLLHTPEAADAPREDFEELLNVFAEQARLSNALGEMAESFVRSRANANEDVDTRSDDGADVTSQSFLERRPGVLCCVRVEGESAGLVSPRGALWMPKTFLAALSFVARTIEFRVSDIPGGLSDGGRVALARRLVGEGVLRVAKPDER